MAVSGGATSLADQDPQRPCPAEFFPALDALPFVRTAFIQRCPGIDVVTDRETALTRLWLAHRRTADALGFSGMPFVLAEQVHGSGVARVDADSPLPAPGGRADYFARSFVSPSMSPIVRLFILPMRKRAQSGSFTPEKRGRNLASSIKRLRPWRTIRHRPRNLVMQISLHSPSTLRGRLCCRYRSPGSRGRSAHHL